MNVVAKLTLKHLLGNKKRTLVTILGIATSTALITAIILGIFSFFRFFGYVAVQGSGNVHAQFNEISREQYEALLGDERVEIVGLVDGDEKKSGIRLANDKEDRYRTGNIEHADENCLNMLMVSDYEGVLPKDSSELAVDEGFLADNGLEDLKIGDSITFEQGYRYIDNELEGFYYLGGNYRSDEKFEALSTETCKITAILHGNKPTKDWDMLRGLDEGYYPDTGKAEVYIRLKDCDHSAVKRLNAIVADYGIADYDYNTEYLLSRFAFEGSEGSFRSFFVMMAMALVIVIITSVILIFNSIGMSLTERMRYLGMLASVGATARQKRFSIYFEGLILGVIAIPLGLLLGYMGTRITLFYLGSRILEADMIVAAEGMRGGIPVVADPAALGVIVLFAALTVLISSLMPAMKAAKVMPIDAIRQTGVLKIKVGRLKVSPLIRKLFGYEGELAYKNIKRNGVKGSVITATMAVSVILFLVINFFCNAVARANQYEYDVPYQVIASCALAEGDKLREAISGMEGVNEVYSAGMIQFAFEKEKDSDTVPANKDITDPAFRLPGFADMDIDSMLLMVIDDAYFNRILAVNGLEEKDFYGDTLRGVLLNDYFHEKKPSEIFNEKILGQTLHYDEAKGFPPAIEIGAFARYDDSEKVYKLVPKATIAVYVPKSVYFAKAKEVLPEDSLVTDLAVETVRAGEVHDSIYELFEKDGYHNYYCSDMTESLKIMDTITLVLKTAMYGFTVLLTLIAVANIVNTISTGVLLRRKEFAMYKSVGMGDRGFKKMMRLETLLYGVRALIIAIPISLIVSFLMYNSFENHLLLFNPDWFMYGAVILAVFGILGISMGLSISRIRDENIIEALKEDA